MGDREQNTLINELIKGKELARQLQHLLNVKSSQETREVLVQQIYSSFERAISILNWNIGGHFDLTALQAGPVIQSGGGMGLESPPLDGSPRSEDSDQDGTKKRKTSPRWTHRVRLHPGTGLEGTLDDGFSWRKYGQKDILGAKYPRGYYRCTHRHVQGCLATKQVQRSDEDPMVFDITYRGTHTCSPPSKPTTLTPQDPQPNILSQQLNPQEEQLHRLRQNLRVITTPTHEQDIHQHHGFHFGSTSTSNLHRGFSPPSMVNSAANDAFMASSSGVVASTTTSPTVDFPIGDSEFDHNLGLLEDLEYFQSLRPFQK